MNKGEFLVKSIDENKVQKVRYFRPDGKRETRLCPPLYVNTTSAGPRGHAYPESQKKTSSLFVDDADSEAVASLYVDPGYAEIELSNDGTIKKVDFRSLEIEKPVFLRNALWSKKESKPGSTVKLMVDVQTENLPANAKVSFEIWEMFRYSKEKNYLHHSTEVTIAKGKTISKKKDEEPPEGLKTIESDWKIPLPKMKSGNKNVSGKLPKNFGDPDLSDIRDGNPFSNLPPPSKPREFYFLAQIRGDQTRSPILYEDYGHGKSQSANSQSEMNTKGPTAIVP